MLLLKYVTVAIALASLVRADNDNDDNDDSSSRNCPQGLTCRTGRYNPHPQGIGYAADPLDFAIPSILRNPNFALLGSLAQNGLESDWGVFNKIVFQFVGADMPAALETPLFIRGNAYLLSGLWNSQSFFYKAIGPVMYNPSVNFPFPADRDFDSAFNSTVNRNIAMAFAAIRMAEYILPKSTTVQGIATSLGIDSTYRGATNLKDPRDIGNIAAAAVISYAKADGWNSESTNLPIWKHPYADQYGFVPTNDAYELKNIAQWQPLVETKDDGNFVVQQHITPQIRAVQGGFAVTRAQLDTTYKVKDKDLLFKHAGSSSDPLSKKELRFLKNETDTILQVSAGLTDETKMVAQFFDNKAISFGAMPFHSVFDFTYLTNVIKAMALDLSGHLALLDATIVAWNEKIRINSVRPISAVRYLYGNTQVNAYAGPYQGTRSISGANWNSYMRTMPHSDFPSGTACICVAFAEHMERFRGTPGQVNMKWDFPPGSSTREPGLTPASWISKNWVSTQEFIRECSYSRVNAGVHFNATIAVTIDLCQGVGAQAYEKFKLVSQGVL